MALIRCNECGLQISDMAKSCPHCGYILEKKKMKKKIEKLSINNRIMALIFLILAFITSLFKGSFQLEWRNFLIKYYTINYSLFDMFGKAFEQEIYIMIFSVFNVISIFFLSIGVLNISKNYTFKIVEKIVNKLKTKKIICYTPIIIYTIVMIGLYITICSNNLNYHDNDAFVTFDIKWGGCWILFLQICAAIFLIIDMLPNEIKEVIKDVFQKRKK